MALPRHVPAAHRITGALERDGHARALALSLVAAGAFALNLARPAPPPGIALGPDLVVLVIVAGCMALWVASSLPEVFTSLLFFFACTVLEVAPAAAVFAGFGSPALWLVLGGMLISMAVGRLRLDEVLSATILRRVGWSYTMILVVVVGAGAALVPLVPSSIGRVLLVVPVVTALAAALGVRRGSRQYAALVCAGTLATVIPGGAILTSHLPNLLMAGAADTLYGIRFDYLAYAWLHAPTVGLVSLAAILAAARLTAPAVFSTQAVAVPPLRPLDAPQRRLLLIVACVFVASATEELHGLPLATVVLGGGLACLLPGIGVLEPASVKDLKFEMLIFVAAAIGMGSVLIETGSAVRLGDAVLRGAGPGEFPAWLTYLWNVGVNWLAMLVANDLASPAILTSLGAQFAAETGWSVESTLLSQVPARALTLMPWQSPALILGFGLAGVSMRQALRFMLTYALIAAPVLIPLHYLWGRALGVFP